MTTCPLCGAELVIGRGAWSRCLSCRAMVFPSSPGPEVVIGHESERVAAQIGGVLLAAGMSPVYAKDPDQLVDLVRRRSSAAVVLDVALEGARAFQIIESLRGETTSSVKIVLIASVFNKTAYKRRPSSLYGADDYVEQHHIPDHLPQRLCALLGLPPPTTTPGETSTIASEAEYRELAGEARVKALAHSIVADIALYHQEEIGHVVRGEPAKNIETALAEGRRLLAEMIDPHVYAGHDPILDAFRALVNELREVVG